MFRHTRAKLVLQRHQVSKPLIDLVQEIGPGPFNILIPEFDDHLGESANRSYRVDRVSFASCVGIAAHRFRSFPTGIGAPSRISKSSRSPNTGTPNWCARSALLPASSPAKTTLVFRDTEPATLAPARLNAASASGRVIPESRPVITTLLPARGPLAGPSPASSSTVRTPAARNFSRTARFSGVWRKSKTPCAWTRPTPGTLSMIST